MFVYTNVSPSVFYRFRLEDDLASRVANGKSLEAHRNDRAARFSLYEDVRSTVSPSKQDSFVNEREGTFLDLLMSEIPGKLVNELVSDNFVCLLHKSCITPRSFYALFSVRIVYDEVIAAR